MEKLTIIKVGGKIVEEKQSLEQLLDSFAAIQGNKLLVHGGGRSATQIAAQLGIETQMVDGRRVTDEAMLKVVTMVYGGLVNKNIVAQLQARHINAMGLTGADLNVIQSHKRLPNPIDFGFVGDVDKVNGKQLANLISTGIVPIMAPLTHDCEGHLLNTNADTIAGEVAKALTPYYNIRLVLELFYQASYSRRFESVGCCQLGPLVNFVVVDYQSAFPDSEKLNPLPCY